MRRCVLVVVLSLSFVSGPGAAAADRPVGDTKVWVQIPDPPGNPEGMAVRNGVVFVGTHTSLSPDEAGEGPSEIHRFTLRTRKPIAAPIKIRGQAQNDAHGILGMAFDARGRLYVLDRNPPRIVRLSGVFSARARQETYATFPQGAYPDYVAFDRNGNAYVTDLENALIYIVSRGGGRAKTWFADDRLQSVFGPNGIAVDRSGERIFFAMSLSQQPSRPGGGIIYTLPLTPRPMADDLREFFVYTDPAAGPDGFAFGRSGKLYVALAGANQLSILTPEGSESGRYPSNAAENQLQSPPYDLPASVAFDGRGSLLVTNQSFFVDDASHMVVFDVWVNDRAQPAVTPKI